VRSDDRGAGGDVRVLLASPLPPPTGGISSWTVSVLESPLAGRFSLRVFDTAPRDDAGVSGRSRFRGDRALASLRMLWGLALELRRGRAAVLHVNTSYQWAMLRDGAFVWIARALGVRSILHFRGGDFPEFVGRCPAWAARLIDATLRRTDRLIALTRHTEAFLVARTSRERVAYLPNFVEASLAATPPPPRREDGVVEILYVGWFIEAKGIRELLAAMRRIEGARLTLVGPTEPGFATSVEGELAALGERVRRLDARPRAELAPLYAEADVFAFPTWREGFPNVVLEAMAAGLPLVTTPVGAIPDVVRDGDEAFVVPVRDADALAEALGRLVEDASLRRAMGERARARAAAFSRERVLGELAELWQALGEARS
jgi:glycosyltransferase involved in cell wall biosynthesis